MLRASIILQCFLLCADDPRSESARGTARYLQLALCADCDVHEVGFRGDLRCVLRSRLRSQRELKGIVVEERGDEVEGEHTNDNLAELLDNGVKNSRALVLVQTANCLQRPWTLLQIFEALRLGKPVMCVHVANGGYDFPTAKEYLADLSYNIDTVNPGALEVTTRLLEERGYSWRTFQRALFTAIPNSIAITIEPGTTKELANASVKDIVMRLRSLCSRADTGEMVQLDTAHSFKAAAAAISAQVKRCSRGTKSAHESGDVSRRTIIEAAQVSTQVAQADIQTAAVAEAEYLAEVQVQSKSDVASPYSDV